MNNRIFLSLALAASVSMSACAGDSTDLNVGDVVLTSSSSEDVFIPDEAWRTVDPENLIIIDTKYGDIGVELFPEIAPNHVAQVKALVRQEFYDNVVFHRVIDDFMNQTGDGTNGDGTGDSTLPDIPAEFTFRRGADMPFTLVSPMKSGEDEIGVGFYKSLQIASQPSSMAAHSEDNKVGAFGMHCKGVTSMARTSDPNSANSQFFLMRAQAQHLDAQYSIWGTTVMGYDLLEKPAVGTIGEVPGWVPDRMNEVDVAADLPEAERPKVQVLRTDHPAFQSWLKSQKSEGGSFPNVCELQIPTRVL